jgi:hypothetical protein
MPSCGLQRDIELQLYVWGVVLLCPLFLSIVHIQIHTHLKWGRYE